MRRKSPRLRDQRFISVIKIKIVLKTGENKKITKNRISVHEVDNKTVFNLQKSCEKEEKIFTSSIVSEICFFGREKKLFLNIKSEFRWLGQMVTEDQGQIAKLEHDEGRLLRSMSAMKV